MGYQFHGFKVLPETDLFAGRLCRKAATIQCRSTIGLYIPTLQTTNWYLLSPQCLDVYIIINGIFMKDLQASGT
jgi:hypothetical protein